MAESPLAGLTILVTRPAGQAAGLCSLIEAAGGRALHLPVLEIVPVDAARSDAGLLGRGNYWDWLIFVSANAVRYALALEVWRDFQPARTRIAAVGGATAKALADAGIRVDLIPKAQFNSESLLAEPELADVAGKKILILRGVGGREHLAEVLRERGAETAYAELYQRIPVVRNSNAILEPWHRGEIRAVVATSGEALAELIRLAGAAGTELRARTPLVVIGSRLAAIARDQGWPQVVAAEASDRGIAAALIRLRHDRAIRTDSEPDPKNTH